MTLILRHYSVFVLLCGVLLCDACVFGYKYNYQENVLFISFQLTDNQVTIYAELEDSSKTYVIQKAEEIMHQFAGIYSVIDAEIEYKKWGEFPAVKLSSILEELGALFFKPIAPFIASSSEIQFVIPDAFITFPLDLLHFRGRPLFLQKPVVYSFSRLNPRRFLLSKNQAALIISDPETDPPDPKDSYKNGGRILKEILPLSSYYNIDEINSAHLQSLSNLDLILISAHGYVGMGNKASPDFIVMGTERLYSHQLTALAPKLVYFDSCKLGVSADFIQGFRDRGTEYYLAPIFKNEAGGQFSSKKQSLSFSNDGEQVIHQPLRYLLLEQNYTKYISTFAKILGSCISCG